MRKIFNVKYSVFVKCGLRSSDILYVKSLDQSTINVYSGNDIDSNFESHQI